MSKDKIDRNAFDEAPVELDIPDGVASAREAVEIIRAWIADGALMVSLSPDAFGDRTADWGRVLGQVAHHVARSAALTGHMSDSEALRAVRSGFESALPQNQPTMSGAIRGRTNH
jgi:hypothetical protein